MATALVQKWWHAKDFSELENDFAKSPFRETAIKVTQLATPALSKSVEGFVAEMGFVQVCLRIQTEPEIMVTVLNITQTGETQENLQTKNEEGIATIQAFLCDFPDAVFMTKEYKPFILLKGKGLEARPEGYLCAKLVKQVFDNPKTLNQHISVGY